MDYQTDRTSPSIGSKDGQLQQVADLHVVNDDTVSE